MKRLFTYIAILTLAVACKDLYGPEETPLAPDTAGSVEITISDVTDNSFKVTLTPSGNVSYYSYLVDNSPAAETLDPETLYKVGYSSVAQGTVKYTSEAPTYSFEIQATPNTSYQVYAVAASEMGFAGNINVKGTKTTDTVAPAIASIQTSENQVMFTFSEAVTRGTGDIKATYYAYYSAEFQQQAAPAGEVTVPADSIQVAGNQTLIAVPNLPTGCYWTISIPEGAYVDAVGQKLPAYASSFVVTEDGVAPKGFYGEVTYIETPMLGTIETESFSDWTKPFVIPMKNTYPIANYSSKKFITVTYESKTSTSTQTTVHTLAPNVTYGLSSAGFVVYLPEQPAFGATVTIDIPAGCIYDIYGNDCEAWSHSAIHSYGYTLDDIVGTYEGTAESYFNGPSTLGFTVAESDDPTKGNVMITGSYMGLPCSAGNIYADFDETAGVFRVYDWQLFLVHPSAGNVLFAINGDNYVDFKVIESGSISAPSVWFGAYLEAAGGWVDIYTDCNLKRVSATNSTAVASVPEITVHTL